MNKQWRRQEQEASKFFIPINGANYRPDREIRKAQNIDIAKLNKQLKTKEENREPLDMAGQKQDNAQNEALAQQLSAFQEMQKQTAELHKQFLDNQAASQKIFQGHCPHVSRAGICD